MGLSQISPDISPSHSSHFNKMQSTGNGVGSLFSGGNGGSLKCPRCGSLNTKFCYYNNYNLSQPRFFCKGCRRYWTMGGVLRNVPVGGGSRKTKRSKHKSGNGKPSSVSVATTCERKSTNSQKSSSESSVVAANISTETTPFTPTESVPTLFNQTLEPPILDQSSTDNRHLFSEIGAFRSLMTSSSDELLISAPEISSLTQRRHEDQVVENQNWNRQHWLQAMDDVKVPELEYSLDSLSNGGGAAEDWGLFDESYWLNNPDPQLNYFL